MRRVNRGQGTGAPGTPASGPCPEPSPLEIGQLLLQQEHVSFELIPLLKDLLNLLSTEAALPCLGWEPWRRRGIRLWKDRLGQGAPRLDRDARGLAGSLGRPGRYHGARPGLWLRVGAEAGWGRTLVTTFQLACWPRYVQQSFPECPPRAGLVPHRALTGSSGVPGALVPAAAGSDSRLCSHPGPAAWPCTGSGGGSAAASRRCSRWLSRSRAARSWVCTAAN